MISIDRETLNVLVARAGREIPRSAEEHRALADARDLLKEDFAKQFPVTEEPSEYEQMTLFDVTPYEV